MNSRTFDPLDIADEARRADASRLRRVDVDPRPTARHGGTVRFVIVAALVSAASLIIVTTLHDAAPRAAAAAVAAPQPAAPPAPAIDHSQIAPDATSAGDAQTVEASIAAYER